MQCFQTYLIQQGTLFGEMALSQGPWTEAEKGKKKKKERQRGQVHNKQERQH